MLKEGVGASPSTVLNVGADGNITDLFQSKGFGFGWWF